MSHVPGGAPQLRPHLPTNQSTAHNLFKPPDWGPTASPGLSPLQDTARLAPFLAAERHDLLRLDRARNEHGKEFASKRYQHQAGHVNPIPAHHQPPLPPPQALSLEQELPNKPGTLPLPPEAAIEEPPPMAHLSASPHLLERLSEPGDMYPRHHQPEGPPPAVVLPPGASRLDEA